VALYSKISYTLECVLNLFFEFSGCVAYIEVKVFAESRETVKVFYAGSAFEYSVIVFPVVVVEEQLQEVVFFLLVEV